jgi:hypothetical protein
MRKPNQIKLGYMDVPVDYASYTEEVKDAFCNNFIDTMLHLIEKELSRTPEINRIYFLKEVLESSLITNENMENYEVCHIINDCLKKLND